MGLDATIPWTDRGGLPLDPAERAGFRKVRYEGIDVGAYLAGPPAAGGGS
jgi:hypothetical protein